VEKQLFDREAFNNAYKALNDAQKRAVDKVEGPVLVIAGPGTGKTQILAIRIGNILLQTDTNPENILCLTYTDAGTVAMRKRLLEFIGPEAHRVHIHTFHAFCNDVIQNNLDFFGKRELEPVTELENIQIIERLLNELPADHPHRKLKGTQSSDISRFNTLFRTMKEENWTTEHVARAVDLYLESLPLRTDYIYTTSSSKYGYKKGDLKQKDLDAETKRMESLRAAAALFPEFNRIMREMGRYDYSDMILWVVNAFKDPSEAGENMLRIYQERFQYILVDEFQDTNGAQNEILQQLISFWEVPNVFVVGDDDQSIYGFQGARVKNIVDFYEAYRQDIEVVVLTDNYRSHQAVLDAARAVIQHNEERLINKLSGLTKDLVAASPRRKTPKEPHLTEYGSEAQEHTAILQHIEQLLANGVPAEEIAVLYYKHKQADALIEAAQRRKIPYRVRKKINILDVPVVRQMLDILEYLNEESLHPHSGEYQLFHIMHFPYFKLHMQDISMLSAWIGTRRDPVKKWRTVLADPASLREIRLRDHEGLERFEKKISAWLQETHNLTLQMLFEKVLNDSGMLHYILEHNERNYLLSAIHTLFNHIKATAMSNPRLHIRDYMDILRQMQEYGLTLEIERAGANKEGVQCITVHSAKGLEFEHVFLLGCNKQIWEGARSAGQFNFKIPDTLIYGNQEREEETMRRLFYVAMTRAKEHLYISYAAASNEGKDLEPSLFVTQLCADTKIKAVKVNISEEQVLDYQLSTLLPEPEIFVDLFDKDQIAERLENFTLSASKLNDYLACPVTFYFRNVVIVPQAKNDTLVFGSAVHYALHLLNDRMLNSADKMFPTLQVFLDDFRKEMRRNEDAFTEIQFKNRIALGEKLLSDYYQTYVPNLPKIAVTEYSVNRSLCDEVPLSGRLDRLEFHGKNVHVIDFKTGNVKNAKSKLTGPTDKNPDGGDYWRQIIFYKILMDGQRVKDWNIVSGEMFFLERDEQDKPFRQHFSITEQETGIVKAQIKETYRRIKQMDFGPGCGECEWCLFVQQYREGV